MGSTSSCCVTAHADDAKIRLQGCGDEDVTTAVVIAEAKPGLPRSPSYTMGMEQPELGGAEVRPRDDLARGKQLREASLRGNLPLVKMLLIEGVDPNTTDFDGWTPLILAAEGGHKEVCETLISHRADASVSVKFGEFGNTALHQAAQYGHVHVVQTLLSARCDLKCLNCNNRTAGDVARLKGHHAMYNVLKAALAEENGPASGSSSSTPMVAPKAKAKTKAKAKALDQVAKSQGEDQAKKDLRLRLDNQLREASLRGALDEVKKLLSDGVDPNMADAQGQTPLIYAAQGGHKEVCESLIQQRADVNAGLSTTGLHQAAQHGHVHVVQTLLEARCDLRKKDINNQTAGDIAKSKGRLDVYDALKAALLRELSQARALSQAQS